MDPKALLSCGVTISILLFLSHLALAETVIATPDSGVISSLSWKSQTADLAKPRFEVQLRPSGEGHVAVAMVRGRYLRPHWSLVAEEKIQINPTGDFDFEVTLLGPVTSIAVVAIGPLGETEQTRLVLGFPGWEEYVLSKSAKPPGALHWGIGLGVTDTAYREEGVPEFTELALSAKGNLSYMLSPQRWEIQGSVHVTLLPLGTDATASARFLGANVRLGYAFPGMAPDWSMTLLGGAYYTTMIVPSRGFGYKNVAGPQLYPMIRHFYSNGRSWAGYLKFSPVTEGVTPLSLDNREVAGGIQWTLSSSAGRTTTLALDAASLNLILRDVSGLQAAAIRCNSLSLTLGLGF